MHVFLFQVRTLHDVTNEANNFFQSTLHFETTTFFIPVDIRKNDETHCSDFWDRKDWTGSFEKYGALQQISGKVAS